MPQFQNDKFVKILYFDRNSKLQKVTEGILYTQVKNLGLWEFVENRPLVTPNFKPLLDSSHKGEGRTIFILIVAFWLS